MARDSNPHSVSIAAPATTAIARVAAAMPTRSWVAMDGVTRTVGSTPNVPCPIPENIATYLGIVSGATVYSNKGKWNGFAKCAEIPGRYHGLGLQEQYNRYFVGTQNGHTDNSVECIFYPTQSTPWNHSFDLVTVNPYTGEVFSREYSGTSSYAGKRIFRFQSGQFVDKSTTPFITIPTSTRTYAGIDWWSGSGLGGGAQGVLLSVSGLDNVSGLDAWDPLTNTWVYHSTLPGWVSTGDAEYNAVTVYSSVLNCAVVGGMNRFPNTLWRVDPNGTVTTLNETPVPVGVAHGQVVADPITGKFLIHGLNGFYELDPYAGPSNLGLYTPLPNTPSGVNKNILDGNGAPGIMLVAFDDPAHLVIGFFSSYVGQGRLHLYKHGA